MFHKLPIKKKELEIKIESQVRLQGRVTRIRADRAYHSRLPKLPAVCAWSRMGILHKPNLSQIGIGGSSAANVSPRIM